MLRILWRNNISNTFITFSKYEAELKYFTIYT